MGVKGRDKLTPEQITNSMTQPATGTVWYTGQFKKAEAEMWLVRIGDSQDHQGKYPEYHLGIL